MITSARVWSAWVVLVLVPALAVAADVQMAGTLGLGYSDNILRVSNNAEDGSIAQAGLELAAAEKTRRFDGDLVADLAYMDYLQNTYSNELVGNARGKAAFNLLEDYVQWVIADNFGQTQTDLFVPITPANSENINYFSTGPDLTLRPAANTELQLGGRYSAVDYQVSPNDSNRVSGTLALVRNIAARSSLSLNAEHDRVDFTNQAVNTDFNNDALYVAYRVESNRTKILMNVGISRIKMSGSTENDSLLKLQVSRTVTAHSTLDLSIGRELTDAGTSFGSQTISQNVSLDTQALSTSTSPYLDEYADLGWNATGRRTRIGASLHYEQQTYSSQPSQDRNFTDVQAYVSRDLGPRVSARLVGDYTKNDYKQQQQGDSNETTFTCGFSFLAGRLLRIDLSVERYDRNSDLADGDFHENRAWLKLRYGDAFVQHVGPFGST